jgi:hypothetical protein
LRKRPGRERSEVGDDRWGPPIGGCRAEPRARGLSWAGCCVGWPAAVQRRSWPGTCGSDSRLQATAQRKVKQAGPSGWEWAAMGVGCGKGHEGRLRTLKILGSNKNRLE